MSQHLRRPASLWITNHGCSNNTFIKTHDDVIKRKHFPRYWPFVWGIHRSPVNSPHKGQWRGTLLFSLICVWVNGWVNNREAGDLRRYRAHYDVIVMPAAYRHHHNDSHISVTFAIRKHRRVVLKHWDRDQMEAILPRTFSSAIFGMKNVWIPIKNSTEVCS